MIPRNAVPIATKDSPIFPVHLQECVFIVVGWFGVVVCFRSGPGPLKCVLQNYGLVAQGLGLGWNPTCQTTFLMSCSRNLTAWPSTNPIVMPPETTWPAKALPG